MSNKSCLQHRFPELIYCPNFGGETQTYHEVALSSVSESVAQQKGLAVYLLIWVHVLTADWLIVRPIAAPINCSNLSTASPRLTISTFGKLTRLYSCSGWLHGTRQSFKRQIWLIDWCDVCPICSALSFSCPPSPRNYSRRIKGKHAKIDFHLELRDFFIHISRTLVTLRWRPN